MPDIHKKIGTSIKIDDSGRMAINRRRPNINTATEA